MEKKSQVVFLTARQIEEMTYDEGVVLEVGERQSNGTFKCEIDI